MPAWRSLPPSGALSGPSSDAVYDPLSRPDPGADDSNQVCGRDTLRHRRPPLLLGSGQVLFQEPHAGHLTKARTSCMPSPGGITLSAKGLEFWSLSQHGDPGNSMPLAGSCHSPPHLDPTHTDAQKRQTHGDREQTPGCGGGSANRDGSSWGVKMWCSHNSEYTNSQWADAA